MNVQAETKEKCAQVATVVDRYRVVIDAGRNEGVNVGQHFLIYNIGDDVIDPYTKESLGRLELIKGTGKIIQVQDKMATLETIEHKKRLKMSNKISEVFEEKRPFESPKVGDSVRFIDP